MAYQPINRIARIPGTEIAPLAEQTLSGTDKCIAVTDIDPLQTEIKPLHTPLPVKLTLMCDGKLEEFDVTEFFSKDPTTVILGRSRLADIQITSPAVSKRHCMLVRSGTDLHLQDLGSRNGTYINGMKKDCSVKLKTGDKIDICGVELTITFGE